MKRPLVAAVLILIAGADSVEERTSSTEYSQSWQKTVITAAETPENRFHFRATQVAAVA